MVKRSWLWMLCGWLFSLHCTAANLLEQHIAARFPKENVVWLEGNNTGQFLALWSASEQHRERGVAILIPDRGHQPISPSLLAYLRTALNLYGWSTLAITPPSLAHDTGLTDPEDTNSTAPTTDADTDNSSSASRAQAEAWQQYGEQLQARIQAAQQYIQNKPVLHLVIVEGSSAAALLQQMASAPTTPPDMMVVIAPYLPERQLNRQIPDWISQGSFPLLDLASDDDNRFASATTRARTVAVKQALRSHYRQRHTTMALTRENSQHWALAEIYGWMRALGWY